MQQTLFVWHGFAYKQIKTSNLMHSIKTKNDVYQNLSDRYESFLSEMDLAGSVRIHCETSAVMTKNVKQGSNYLNFERQS